MSAMHPGQERLEDSAGNSISRGGRAAQPHGKGSVATIGISTTSEVVTDNKKKTQPFQAGIEEMGSRSGLRAVSNRLLSRAGFSSAHFLLTKIELKPTHDSAPHGAQCSTPTPTEPSPYRSWLQTNPLRTAAVPEHQQMNHPPIHTASEAL